MRKVVTPSDRCHLTHQSVRFSQECGLKVQKIRTFVFKSRLTFQICFFSLHVFQSIQDDETCERTGGSKRGTAKKEKLLTKVKVLSGSQVERCIFSIRDSHSGNTSAERLHINTESVQSSAHSRRLGHGAGEFWSFIHRHRLPVDSSFYTAGLKTEAVCFFLCVLVVRFSELCWCSASPRCCRPPGEARWSR